MKQLPSGTGKSGDCPQSEDGHQQASDSPQPAASTDPIQDAFSQLTLGLKGEQDKLADREKALSKSKEDFQREKASMLARSARSSDIIHLNVGGRHLDTTRRTLTMVHDSQLAHMFNGRWEDNVQRDDAGRVFLDFHPGLFTLLLNWLRAQDLVGPEAHLLELVVPAGEEEQLLVLVDFLQLQRHVPLKFIETFSSQVSSPHVILQGATVWRAISGVHSHFAVAATTHVYFDVVVELLLEVLHFGAAPSGAIEDDSPLSAVMANMPMFIGVMSRQQLETVDWSKKKCNPTWQSSCYGWWTSRKKGCSVAGGKSRQTGNKLLWCEGDSLQLNLDCRKNVPTMPARLTLTNLRTNVTLSHEIDPGSLGCEERWVVVVGLCATEDEIRINTARRRGTPVDKLAPGS